MKKVRCYINNKPRELIRARVEKNGTRAVDTAEFTLPRQVAVTKGDKITYIQDVVNTKSLVGVWNFFNATRDEGGYDLDGSEASGVETDAAYIDDDGEGSCDGKVISFSGSNTSRAIRIDDDSHIDFSGQFDIVIWCQVPYSSETNAGFLFSKGNSTNYVKISHTAVSSNASYAKAEIKIGSSTMTPITGTNVNLFTGNASYMDSSQFHFIRLKRDENDLVTLSVDGTTEGTQTISGNASTSSTYLYLGGDIDGSNRPIARMAQIRLYSGGYLTDDDYTTLRQTRRQPNTMKFGGIVWKVDEKPTYTKVYCKAFGKILHESIVVGDTTSVSPTWTTGDANITRNVYRNKTGIQIITDLCKIFNTGIRVVDVDDNITSSYTEYHAKGSIFDNVLLLAIMGKTDSSYSIDARKVLRFEDDDIDYYSGGGSIAGNGTSSGNDHSKFSPITFKQGVIRVKDLGYDDSTVATYLTVITGDITTYPKTQTLNSGGGSNDFNLLSDTAADLTRKPLNDPRRLTLTHSDGTVCTYSKTPTAWNQFYVDTERKYLILGEDPTSSHTGTYTLTYDYEDISTSNYFRTRGGDQATLGEISKVMYVPQLMGSHGTNNLSDFAQRYISKFGTLNRRVSLVAPTLLNHIRENYRVKVIDDTHGISTASNLSVRSMTYYYPEGFTEVNLGDHAYDAFDLDNSLSGSLYELRNNFTQSDPA